MSDKVTERIGNVIMNYEYYTGQDNYSDGDIENDILHLVEETTDVMKILAADNRWPVLYHLSPVRQNILDWYDMKPEATVLEIGAGCGAITGALCQKAKRVVCNDLSKRRSLINANRNREYDNLEIRVGNFNDVVFEEKFDYITLIGVLEYARYYTDAPDPFVGFLEKIRGLLKEDGKLLIAIENKYGLKYFAGAREDHTGHFFDGIEGYRQTESEARTFSREMLGQMIEKAGYRQTEFYYPFPDYKFPTQIFSDKHLPKAEDLILSRANYDNTRMYLFNEAAAYEEILKDGMFPFFSNSFFIEASLNQTQTGKKKTYSKFTKERIDTYQIETMMYEGGDRQIGKRALYPQGEAHISKLLENYSYFEKKAPGILAGVHAWDAKQAVEFEYIDGNSLAMELDACVERRDSEGFFALLEKYKELARTLCGQVGPFEASAEFEEVYGSIACLEETKGARKVNADLNFDNIIMTEDGRLRVIDYEWIADFMMPVDFPIYRALYAYYMRSHTELNRLIPIEESRSFFGISETEWDAYTQMNDRFNAQIMGNGDGYADFLKKYEKDQIDLGTILAETTDFAQTYIDRGNGFSEEDSSRYDISCDGKCNEITVMLSGDEKILRIDPMNPAGIIELLGVWAEVDKQTTSVSHFTTNASLIEGTRYLFLSEDPQLIVSLEEIGAASGMQLIVKYRIISRFTDTQEKEETKLLQQAKAGAADKKSLLHRGKDKIISVFKK